MGNVRTYANSELKKTSVLYSQTVDIIKKDYYTESSKFTRKDLK